MICIHSELLKGANFFLVFYAVVYYLHIEAIVKIRLHYSRHLINTQPKPQQPGRDYSVN